uniref:GDNF/GAS1 domain-containing protein n=1 Tax=Panagrolaimus davidi TaxID=227884 RepID=A0A914Q4Z1_9BILA
MNLYQNVHGRRLLRTDASCVPGRSELDQCGFLPNKSPKHCNFAKLICEADLQCNSKWEVFISECEAETNIGQCSDKCRKHLNSTLSTSQGSEFSSCSCTDKDDQLCIKLKDTVLKACMDKPTNSVIPKESSTPITSTGSRGTIPPRVGRPTVTPDEPDAAVSLSLSLLALVISFLIASQNFF